MARPIDNPEFIASHRGVLHVTAADSNWHAVASEDMDDLDANADNAALPAGLVLVSVQAVNEGAADAALCTGERSGAADRTSGVKVYASKGSASVPVRGGAALEHFSYAGTSGETLVFFAQWDAA